MNARDVARAVHVCLLMAVLSAHAPLLLAQTDRGTITGTVTDPQGAVVPGASVSLKNVATGADYPTVSTGTGNYTVPALPAGRYSLTVAAPGFNRYIQEGITVQVAQTARIDVVLKIGATSESVTVQADAPLLRTE
ncbi:MAG TPA: carboxypeptidase-like regulatory domain-containing protein, partial [Bryobacteraceae bacterium]|nr:carboxypeptidase-like regulatory domain-containing protein [Bryobacteraceae bacterium]